MITVSSLIILIVALYAVYALAKRVQKEQPALGFSRLFPTRAASFKIRLLFLQKPLFFLALGFFGLALCNPTWREFGLTFSTPTPRKGIAIYLLIDESGSMAERRPYEGQKEISKSDFVKQLADQIIAKRENDLIGLIGFARKADIICPLTLDKKVLLSRLKGMHVITSDDEEGTAIGYAIFKTVNLIVSTKHFAEREKDKKKPAYTIDNQIIIVLTDGLQSPNPLDKNNPYRFMRIEEACDAAAQNGIRVYYVGVDPVLENSEFKSEADKMKNAVEQTKGEFFIATSNAPIQKIFSQIDALTKSELFVTQNEPKSVPQSLSPLCIALALIFLSLAVLIETVFARVCP